MYIISKHKDYYDSVAGQKGIDKTIVFERANAEITYAVRTRDIKSWWTSLHFPSYGGGERYGITRAGTKHFELFLVGFCGKMYVGAKITATVPHAFRKMDTETIVTYIYGLDYIKAAICKYFDNDKYFTRHRDSHLEHMLSFTTDKKILELFYTYKTPQFILYGKDENNLHINGNLKEIQFFKLFDPYVAFQEIEMYITGVLGINNKPMVEISDKHKIVGHGFDPKYSFRKEPEDKNKKK